jgi:hypothetical protein
MNKMNSPTTPKEYRYFIVYNHHGVEGRYMGEIRTQVTRSRPITSLQDIEEIENNICVIANKKEYKVRIVKWKRFEDLDDMNDD